MAENILKLKVDSTSYDQKIKRAAQGLQHMEEAAKKSGRSLDTLTKEEKAYISALGKMDTVSRDARGRVNELTKTFTDLSYQYNHLSDAAKKGEFGKELSKQLEILKTRAIDARKELNTINSSIGNVPATSGISGMGGFNLAGMAGGAMKFAGAMGLAVSAADLFRSAITNNISTALEFEDSISKLSSLTGMVGKDLETLKGYAIELGGSTTQSASQVAQAFMLIGSQKPELLKNSEALKDVTKAAITLGEAANIDVTEAAKALTASLNIMGEGADQATRYINVLAAGSKEGSVDIAGLTEVVFKAGQAAKMNKMSFEQLVAVAESIGPSFGSSAEAGTALNAMLLKLETQTETKYKPSVVGLENALINLKKANISAKDATKLVTETGYKALVPLLQNVDGVNKLQKAITGTNTAEDQAKTNTDNLKGSLANLNSAWERFNLTLNSSNGWFKTAVDWLTSLVNGTSDLIGTTNKAAEARERLNKALNATGSNGQTKTRGQQIAEYNKQKRAADAEVARAKSQYFAKQHAYASGTFGTNKGDVDRAKQAWEDAVAAQRAIVAEGKQRFYSKPSSPSKTTTTTTPSSDSTDSKNKTTKETYKEGEVGYIKEKIAELEKQLNHSTSAAMSDAINAQIARLKGELYILQGNLKFKVDTSDETGKELRKALDGEPMDLHAKLKADTDGLTSLLKQNNPDPIYDVADNYAMQKAREKYKPEEKDPYEGLRDSINTLSEGISALSQINSGLAQMGIELPGAVGDAINAISGLMNVVGGVMEVVEFANSIMGGTAITADAANTTATIANTAAMGALTGALVANTTSNFIPLHTGGLVHAAQGVFVPGSPNGGRDTVPAMLSPGELVLNYAQQNNIARDLQSSGNSQNIRITGRIYGEDILLTTDHTNRRRGRSESAIIRG